jgi:hypothetical protein
MTSNAHESNGDASIGSASANRVITIKKGFSFGKPAQRGKKYPDLSLGYEG